MIFSFEDEEDAAADEEGLMRGQGLVQEEEVAFAGPQRGADAGRTPPRKRQDPISSLTTQASADCIF